MFLNSNKKDKIILQKHIHLEEKLLTLFDKKEEIELNQLNDILIEFKNLNQKEYTINLENLSFVKKKKINNDLITCYENVKKEIVNCLDENKVPTIHISKWVNFLRLFSNEILEKECDISNETTNKIAMLSNVEEEIPLSFKNGKKIIISKVNFDLTELTYEELVELLRLLDVTISDNKYDYLRTEIVKQITSISSISNYIN